MLLNFGLGFEFTLRDLRQRLNIESAWPLAEEFQLVFGTTCNFVGNIGLVGQCQQTFAEHVLTQLEVFAIQLRGQRFFGGFNMRGVKVVLDSDGGFFGVDGDFDMQLKPV